MVLLLTAGQSCDSSLTSTMSGPWQAVSVFSGLQFRVTEVIHTGSVTIARMCWYGPLLAGWHDGGDTEQVDQSGACALNECTRSSLLSGCDWC